MVLEYIALLVPFRFVDSNAYSWYKQNINFILCGLAWLKCKEHSSCGAGLGSVADINKDLFINGLFIN